MNNDLISISEAKKLGATCLARRNENGQLEAIISLDNAPTVEPFERIGAICNENCGINRPSGEWIDRMADKGYVECPFCHKQISGGDLNFCVKCGADMREGDET